MLKVISPKVGELFSVGPFLFDVDDCLSVRLMNLGWGIRSDPSIVCVLSSAKGYDCKQYWKVIILHRDGEIRYSDNFKFPLSYKCERIV